jgi:hypothetical protein
MLEPQVNAYQQQNKSNGGLTRMGKTVPSYRMVVEWEIGKWKNFRNALASEEEREAFDELMDMCRKHATEGSCATNPIIFEPMAISILLSQQKKIRELEKKTGNH